ncbi:MAG: phosphoribosylaminoimidazolesuccinocarboxamide synthase [Christensenellaceae bacterium]|jgi:phosphoribosylaminoimidazole-succinocarboxamide synthase|nr:phosphoribosylaminoimidazolesuccinocarboxamide synthase [Christensenellaceae bacterium]
MKKEQLYEGKAKRVFLTDEAEALIVSYKDDATAFNGLKKGTITGKGVINNRMSNFFMQKLEKEGVPTHFIEELSERETKVKRVKIVPLEVIVRNIAAGSFSKRFGVEEGTELKNPTIEYCLKDDALGDPMINDSQIFALGLAGREELGLIAEYTFKLNDYLKSFLLECGIVLVDFKVEFGRTSAGQIVLADEISPDTCRFWDAKTREKLDKDRFRRDLGGVEDAYNEVARRIFGL